MPANRPASFIVFAIINFLFAVVFIACGVCANLGETATWHVQINNVRFDPDTLRLHLNQTLPGFTAIKITGIVLGYLICIGLILSGVALLIGKWWGGALALLTYAFAFVHHVFFLVYYIAWVLPAMNQFFNRIPPGLFASVGVIPMVPVYTSLAWWGVGTLYYLLAAPLVLWGCFPARRGDDEDSARQPRPRRDERDDDDDCRPRRKPRDRDDA